MKLTKDEKAIIKKRAEETSAMGMEELIAFDTQVEMNKHDLSPSLFFWYKKVVETQIDFINNHKVADVMAVHSETKMEEIA